MTKYIHRSYEKEILNLSKTFPVIMVTGSRQVGKTTMLNYIAKSKNTQINYVTLDNIHDRELALTDPELFLEIYKTPVIIDEFQYAPNLLPYIKIKVDKMRMETLFENENQKEALYYLTGSQSFLSMKDVTESLAGRVGILDLYGLSTREISQENSHPFIPELEEIKKNKPQAGKLTLEEVFNRIFKGSFPEIYRNPEIPLNRYFDSYIRTYIERDIRDLIRIKDEVKFLKFITSIAARTGEELNLSEVANDAEISVPTANEWLSILVNTNLIILIEPYSKNMIKRVVKRPKLYFMDTGLACYLTKYPTAEILASSAYAGHIFETYVVSEIIKSFFENGINAKRHLYYYRDNNAKEIDLIIDYNDRIYPIEIKKSKNPGHDAIKNFKVLESMKREVGNGIVLCMIEDIFPIDKNNYLVPIWYI